MKHEQAVADALNRFLSRKAAKFGRNIHSLALDGQDRDAGDYLLTDESEFAIIEFKHTDVDISLKKKKKNKKPRRLRPCESLEANAKMTASHDRCHFIAWTQLLKQYMQPNVYRHDVCNRKFSAMGAN
ncbi:hypothetical protein [Sorangium sp. So ce362]|uniref:hypothetical protein n=1 Tax=Sorangium sp. So ce362 TaxID=3133303 RepID=UPI003F6028B5